MIFNSASKSNTENLPSLSQSEYEDVSDVVKTSNDILLDSIPGKLNQHDINLDYKGPSDTAPRKKADQKNSKGNTDEQKLLLKILSAISNNSDGNKNLDDKDRDEINSRVDKITQEFYKAGIANYKELNSLIKLVKSIKDSDGNRVVKIESEDEVDNVIAENNKKQVTERAYQAAFKNLVDESKDLSTSEIESLNNLDTSTTSINSYLHEISSKGIDTSSLEEVIKNSLSVSAISNNEIMLALKDELKNLSSENLDRFNKLKDSYNSKSIDSDSFVNQVNSDVLGGVSNESEPGKKLDQLNEVLKVIAKNTDPDTGQISNAEMIRQKNQDELEAENSKKIADALNNVNTDDNNKVKSNLLEGVKSSEDAGEKLTDSLLDKVFGDGNGGDIDNSSDDRKGRKNGAKSDDHHTKRGRNGKPQGKFGKLLDEAKQLGSKALDSGSGLLKGGAATAGTALASEVGTASKVGSGLLGTAGKVIGKAAVPLSIAISAGTAINEYSEADDDFAKHEAVGGGVGGIAGSLAGAQVGALAGATIGSIIPGAGTVVGGAIGGVVGAVAGGMAGTELGKKVAGWFSSPEDSIPDAIKESGPIYEIDYIDRILLPALSVEAENPDGEYDASDIKDLMSYRQELIDDKLAGSMEDLIKNAPGDSEEKVAAVMNRFSNMKSDNADLYDTAFQKLPEQYKETYKVQKSQDDANSEVTPSNYKFSSNQALGSLSAKYESGRSGVGTISSGKGDAGGVSYGKHQLASKTGTMKSFIDSKEGAQFKGSFEGLTPGSVEFNKAYAKVADEQGPDFEAAQHDFIQRTHYEPVAKMAEEAGIDITNPGIKEALWSQSVQHGRKGNKKIIDGVIASGVDLKDNAAVIKAIYGSRTDYASQFASGSATTERYKKEMGDALAINTQSADSPLTPGLESDKQMMASANKPADIDTGLYNMGKNQDGTKDVNRGTEYELTADETKLLTHYTDQGMTDVAQLSVATNIDPKKLSKAMSKPASTDLMANQSGDYDVASIKKEPSSNTTTESAPQQVVAAAPSPPPSTSDSDFRISDISLGLASQMI